MTFTPEPTFRVLSIVPEDGLGNLRVGSTMSIVFNSPLDPLAFSSIHIAPPVSGIWTYSYYSDSTRISFVADNSLELGTTYTLTIDTTARDQFGSHLAQEVTSHFSTEPLRIEFTFPSDGNTNVDRDERVYVYMNAPIDTATAPAAFSLSSPVAGIFQYDYAVFTFLPDSVFQPNAQYTITVSSALRSRSGKALPTAYVFSFTTGD